jgi:hypothetical protein
MAVRLSALRAGRSLPPGRFLVLISVRVDPRAIVTLEQLRVDQLKTSSHLIRNRIRIVPQPTMVPHAPNQRI